MVIVSVSLRYIMESVYNLGLDRLGVYNLGIDNLSIYNLGKGRSQ